MVKFAVYRTTCMILICFAATELLQGEDSIMVILNDMTFNRILDQGIEYQQRADSLHQLSVDWRKQAAGMDDPTARGRLQQRIIQIEDSVEIYMGLANDHFNFLTASLPEKPREEFIHPYLIQDTVLNGIKVFRYNLSDELMEKLAPIPKPAAPALPIIAEDGNEVDTKAINYQSGFKIYESSPYSKDRPFERNFSVPPGVFYRIQLAAFGNEPEPDQFGGLSPITTEPVPGQNLTRYFVGKFTHMEEASSALVKVRSLGYPDAYVIGYYDAQKISLLKLKTLEK